MTEISTKDMLAGMDQSLCVVEVEGKARVLAFRPREHVDGGRQEAAVLADVASMRTMYANQFIEVRTGDDGAVVRKPLFPYWLQRKQRPTAYGLTIHAGGDRFVDGMANLWRGLAVEAKVGGWPLLEAHIDNVVGDGMFGPEAEYILRWAAWVLQNPTKPAEVVLVLQGEKGTGKGEFLRLLLHIFGIHGLQISDRKMLVGNFNKHLQGVCFLYADEAFWPGDKAGEGALKRLITEPTLVIEPKGIDAYEAPNRLSIAMSSNERWVVPATEDERRYAVFKVKSSHKGDFAYFAALRKEVYENGGAEAFLHDMLSMDLCGWHPRQGIPTTRAMYDQQDESARPEAQWLMEILDEGQLPHAVKNEAGVLDRLVSTDDPAVVKAGLLFEHFKAKAKSTYVSPSKFWEFLSALGVARVMHSRASGRWRRFPPLLEARGAFSRKYPWKTEWSDHTDQWTMPDDTNLYERW